MAEEQCVAFGLSGWGTVWSVDDAWFEGINPNKGDHALAIANEISFDDCGNDYQKLLEAIAMRREKQSELGEVVLGDEFNYLEVVAQLCEEHNLYLKLCNFEYFESHYQTKINKEKSAILLDINYADFQRADKTSPVPDEQYSAENYGYLLLADVIKGEPPRARILFMTSFENLAQEVRELHRTTSRWWPLRSIPYISKSSDLVSEDTLEDQLRAFIINFRQGEQNSYIREFSNALLQAHLKKFTHPDDIAAKVPQGFLLKEVFMMEGGLEAEQDSFKALYKFDKKSGGKSDRDLLTRIFISHLKHAGVNAEANVNDTFRLPVEPGMLFVLCLLDLHDALKLDKETIMLSCKAGGSLSGIAEIFIPLTAPSEFKAAFFTRESDEGAVNALRRLLGCKETVFVNHVEAEAETVNPFINSWKANRMTSSGHYKIIVKPIFGDDGLTLTWDYALSPEDEDL